MRTDERQTVADKPRQRLLSDHRKIGKTYVPPLMDTIGSRMRETPWLDTLPELVWIACLHDAVGLARGTAVAAALGKAATEANSDTRVCFAAASAYSLLTEGEKETVLAGLARLGQRDDLKRGLSDLCHLYPANPLSFLCSGEAPSNDSHQDGLEPFKDLLLELFDKTARPAIMMQGTAVYVAGLSGKLRFSFDSVLANLPELERYPDTVESRMVAAAVRSAIPMLVRLEEDHRSDWASYFWNRGLEIEPCGAQL